MVEISEFAKETRQITIWTNTGLLGLVIAAALALVWLGPADSDLGNIALGLLSTIAGMLVKNLSTVVDCVFGGSDKG